jgi:hypothetical protein
LGELDSGSEAGKNPWISGLRRAGMVLAEGIPLSAGLEKVGDWELRKSGSFCIFVIFSPMGDGGYAFSVACRSRVVASMGRVVGTEGEGALSMRKRCLSDARREASGELDRGGGGSGPSGGGNGELEAT